MALSETSFVDKCEVVSFGSTYITAPNQKASTVQVRIATVIEKDGNEVARSFERHVVVPGQVFDGATTLTPTDISGEMPEVQAICNAVWTTASKEAYRQYQVGIRSEGRSF